MSYDPIRFTTGRQPCATYTPKDDLFPGSGNIHSCLAPFAAPYAKRCAETRGGLVSFCVNCTRDHHQDGYETCAGLPEVRVKPPKSGELRDHGNSKRDCERDADRAADDEYFRSGTRYPGQ